MPFVFDDRQLLPPGIHDATLAEIEKCLAYSRKSERRQGLFKNLATYVAAVKRTGWACSILIDGSFIMPLIDEPNDIDIILVMPENWDMAAELRPFEYNLVSKRSTAVLMVGLNNCAIYP